MEKETKAERERRFQEEYDRRLKNAPIFSWPLKLLLFCMALGFGGFIGLKYYRHQLATWLPSLITEDAVATDSNSAMSLAAPTQTVSEGVIGDQLLKDEVIFSVVDTKSIDLNKRGVAVYVVSAVIGNGSKKPLNCPAVEGLIYDTDDRQYAAVQKEGQYAIGTALNPLLCLDQRWAFVVPEGVTFKRFELSLPSHNLITVDLSQRTPGNKALLAAAERERMKAAQDQFAARIADSEDRKNRDEEAKAKTLATLVAKTSESRDSINTKFEAATQKRAASEKNVQKLQKRLKSMENLVSTGQLAVDKFDALWKKATVDLVEVQRQYNLANGHERMRLDSAVAKAKGNVEIQNNRLEDATKDLSDRKVKLNDATLELAQETRTLTALTKEVAQLNAELDKLDNTLQEHQHNLDELKAKDATAVPELTPAVEEKKAATAPAPPPDPEGLDAK